MSFKEFMLRINFGFGKEIHIVDEASCSLKVITVGDVILKYIVVPLKLKKTYSFRDTLMWDWDLKREIKNNHRRDIAAKCLIELKKYDNAIGLEKANNGSFKENAVAGIYYEDIIIKTHVASFKEWKELR